MEGQKDNNKPKPQPRIAINHNRKCNTFLSKNNVNKPKIGNTNRESKLNSKLNVTS